jgi:hypothetical protein
MGAWGTAIFDDDVAANVANTWSDTKGGTVEATRAVYEEFGDSINDEDDRPIIFFALASLQLDAGVLEDNVREVRLRR